MREIFIDVENGSNNTIKVTEGDNLTNAYKLVIKQNQIRLDLTNKKVKFAFVKSDSHYGDIIEELEIINAIEGEVKFEVVNRITKVSGVYSCGLAVYNSETGYLEHTGTFNLYVRESIFEKVTGELLENSTYKKLMSLLDRATNLNKELTPLLDTTDEKTNTLKETISTADALNTKLVNNTNTANTTNTTLESNIEEGKRTNSDSVTKDTTLKATIKKAEDINSTLTANADEATLNEEARKVNEEGRVEAEKLREEKTNSFDARVTKNTDDIASNRKDIERSFEVINDSSFLPFTGQDVKVEHSKVGFTKDMSVEGMTYQNLLKNNLLKPTDRLFSYLPQRIISNDYAHIKIEPKSNAFIFWVNWGSVLDLLKTSTKYTVLFDIDTNVTINYLEIEIKDNGASNSNSTKVILNNQPIKGKIKLNLTTKSSFITSDQKQCLYINGKYTESDNSNNYITLSNPIIIEGEPSYIPNHFEGIKSVGEKENKISILSHGKNLFRGYEQFIKVKKGEQLYLSSKATEGCTRIDINVEYESDINAGSILYWRDDVKVYRLSSDRDKLDLTFTVNRDCNIKITNSFLKVKEYNEIQLEKGIKATPFELYKQDKKEILLPYEGGFKGFPNGAKDTLEERQDGIYIVQRVGRKVLNGNEDIILWTGLNNTTDTIGFVFTAISNMKYESKMLSDKFTWLTMSEGSSRDCESVITSYNNKLYIRILRSKLEIQDVAGFKKWLNQNPVTIYYELATPVEYKILDVNSIELETFKDVTYTDSNNEIKPHLTFKAPVDVPATISSLKSTNTMLMVQNTDLQNKNEQLEEVNKKQTKKIIELDDTTGFLIEDALTRKLNN